MKDVKLHLLQNIGVKRSVGLETSGSPQVPFVKGIGEESSNSAADIIKLEKPTVRLPKYFPRSPLRYPGGKTRALKLIHPLIPPDETKLFSPFLGGGSLELLYSVHMQVIGADICAPLITFWNTLKADPQHLADMVEAYIGITNKGLRALRRGLWPRESKLEIATAYYVLNRCSFSGCTLTGGFSKRHDRFNLGSVQNLRNFQADNFSAIHADYRQSIPKYSDYFLYVDPPYDINQNLYGYKTFTLKSLADRLLSRDRWLLSFNDTPEIRRLFHGHLILPPTWTYSMSNDKTSDEILVFSNDLPDRLHHINLPAQRTFVSVADRRSPGRGPANNVRTNRIKEKQIQKCLLTAQQIRIAESKDGRADAKRRSKSRLRKIRQFRNSGGSI